MTAGIMSEAVLMLIEDIRHSEAPFWVYGLDQDACLRWLGRVYGPVLAGLCNSGPERLSYFRFLRCVVELYRKYFGEELGFYLEKKVRNALELGLDECKIEFLLVSMHHQQRTRF